MNKNLLMLCVFFSLVMCIFSNLVVRSPLSLKQYFQQKYGQEINGIPFSIANFGEVPYGRSIIGELAAPSVLQNCIYEDIPNIDKTKKIILSERNDCKFTQKALNTQNQGGIMSIIIDNVVQNPGRIIMVDDGHGSQIHIPTIMISKQDGDQILKAMKNQTVSLSVYFDTLKAENAVINLYLDITDRSNFVFLRKFRPHFEKIKKYVKMSLNYATVSCKNCQDGDCYYNGTFCKKILYGWVPNAGHIFIKQQLREFFIFRQYPDKWWDYMDQFDQYCSETTQQSYLEQCSIDAMKAFDIDSNRIMKLVDDSFESETNPILLQSSAERLLRQIMYYPAVVVNNITYRGNLQAYELKQLICNSLKTTPAQCQDLPFEPKSEHIIVWIILSIIGFLVLLIFIIFCYRRLIRRRLTNNMNKQVNQLVDQYITMYEADKFKGDHELNSRGVQEE